MSHWALQYQGARWSEQTDCLHWFRKISLEQFGRTVPECTAIDYQHHLRSTIRVMRSNIAEMFGYRQTDAPVEGDAVFMSQSRLEHHIGMVIFLGGRMHVLHVLDGCGLVISDRLDLAMNGWKITSYWTPCC